MALEHQGLGNKGAHGRKMGGHPKRVGTAGLGGNAGTVLISLAEGSGILVSQSAARGDPLSLFAATVSQITKTVRQTPQNTRKEFST